MRARDFRSFIVRLASRTASAVLLGLALIASGPLAAQDQPATDPEDTPPIAETVVLPPADGGKPLGPGMATAVAFLDGDPRLGTWVQLDGSASRDPEGGPAGFEWKRLAGPKVRMFDEQARQPKIWVLLEDPGRYRFELRVLNSRGWSAPVEVAFVVKARQLLTPITEFFSQAGFGEKIELKGEGWKQIHGPATRLRLATDGSQTVVRLVKPGLYIFEAFHAGDLPIRKAYHLPPGKNGKLGTRRPEARLQPVFKTVVGREIVLDAGLSSDPDGETLVARWAFDDAREIRLVRNENLKGTFLPMREGIYKIVLVVNDGKMDSHPVSTYLHVEEAKSRAVRTDKDVLAGEGALSKRVSLSLYHSTLDTAIQMFPTRCGITLRVDPEAIPSTRFKHIPLHMGVHDTPAWLLMDWVSHQTDTAYRVESEKDVWLMRPGWWSETEPLKSAVFAADALYKKKDGSDLLRILQVAFRDVLTNRRGATLAMQAETQKVVSVLPQRASKRLEEVLVHLRAPKGLGLPPRGGRTDPERAMRRLLAEHTVDIEWVGRRFDLAFRDLSERAGLAVGYDPRDVRGEEPRVTLTLKNTPLRQAVRDLVHQAGFDGCQVVPGGLWFYKGDEPYPSGQVLWDHLVVRAYEIDAVLEKLPLLSGEAVAHLIRQRVYAESWKHPPSMCEFHDATGKLLVLHGIDAHIKVADVLNDLFERGEDALGGK